MGIVATPSEASSGPLLDREDALSVLSRSLPRSRSSAASAAIVTGPAGCGKTAVLRVTRTTAERRGATCLHLAGRSEQAGVPYLALRGLLRSLGERHRHSEPADKLSGVLERPADADPREVRIALISLLREVGATSTGVLFIDDADRLDEESLETLSTAIADLVDLPLTLVLARRPVAPGRSPALDRLETSVTEVAKASRVELEELQAQAVSGMIPEGHPHPLDTVMRLTRGNPALVHELIGSPDRDAPYLDVEARRRVVERFLPPDRVGRAAANALAVRVRMLPDELGLLSELAGEPEAAVEHWLDELIVDAVVEELPDGSLQLRHPLIGEVLHHDIGVLMRRRMHRAVADHLQERAGASVLEIAHHLEHAAPGHDAGAAGVFASAGDVAFNENLAEAARWYGLALGCATPQDPLRAELLSKYARTAVWSALPMGESVDAAQRALAALVDGADRDRTRAAAANGLMVMARCTEALQLLDAEEAATDTPVIPRERTNALVLLRRLDEASHEVRLALRASPPESLERAITLSQLAHLYSEAGKTARMAEVLRAQRRMAAHAPPTVQLRINGYACYFLALHGHLDAASEALENATALDEALGGRALTGMRLPARTLLDWCTGEWERLLAEVPERQHILIASNQLLPAVLIAAVADDVLTQRGAPQQHLDGLPLDGVDLPPTAAELHAWARAGAQFEDGNQLGAMDQLDGVLRRQHQHGPVSHLLAGRLVDFALAMGALEEAAQYAGIAELVADRLGGGWSRVTALRARAEVERDPECATAALAAARTLGHPFEIARCATVVADLGIDTKDQLLGALRLFRALGSERWIHKVGVMLRANGYHVPNRRSVGKDRLTPSEMRVALLVRDGLKNREIAERLCYSVRTVEVYLSRIFVKTGCSSRLELATKVDLDNFAPDRGSL